MQSDGFKKQGGNQGDYYSVIAPSDIEWYQKCLFYEQRVHINNYHEVRELETKIEHLLIEIERLSLFVTQKGSEVEKWKMLYHELESSESDRMNANVMIEEFKSKYVGA